MTPQQEIDIARTQLFTHLKNGLEKIYQLEAIKRGEEYPTGDISSNELLSDRELTNVIERFMRSWDSPEATLCLLESLVTSLVYLYEELKHDWDEADDTSIFEFMRCVPSKEMVEKHMDRYRKEGRFWEKDETDNEKETS
jgi:hypothetical protein